MTQEQMQVASREHEAASQFKTGMSVTALIEMTNDLRQDGMGVQLCASRGDKLIVRGHSLYGKWIYVSHEGRDNESFCVEPEEIALQEAA